MRIVAFAMVVKSTTRSDDAAARTARAFWSAVATSHVHDFEFVGAGLWLCKSCPRTMRRVPG